jgi:hypothetical protein
MKSTLVVVTAALLFLGFFSYSHSETLPDNESDLQPGTAKAIGIGWKPFPHVFTGTTLGKLNIRSQPDTKSVILKTVEKGTSLQLLGISAVKDRSVMDEGAWKEWETEFYGEEPGLRLRPGGWYRVIVDGKTGWAYQAFVKSESAPLYLSPADMPHGGFGISGYVFRFDAQDNFAEAVKDMDALQKTELILKSDLPEQYGYDLSYCSEKACNLYIQPDFAGSKAWFGSLPADGILADYLETSDGVWIADMSTASVRRLSADGGILGECKEFTLPLRLLPDGGNGIWVNDFYTGCLVHLNATAQPTGSLNNSYILAAELDNKNRIRAYGYFSEGAKWVEAVAIYTVNEKGDISRQSMVYQYDYESFGDNVDKARKFEEAEMLTALSFKRALLEPKPDGEFLLYCIEID